MVNHVTTFKITTPAGTQIATPHVVHVRLGLSDVSSILCVVPPGPAGLVGFNLSIGGTQVYPVAIGQWFIFDDYNYVQDVRGQPKTGQWDIQSYNLDTYDHVIYFYFNWDDVDQPLNNVFSLPLSL